MVLSTRACFRYRRVHNCTHRFPTYLASGSLILEASASILGHGIAYPGIRGVGKKSLKLPGQSPHSSSLNPKTRTLLYTIMIRTVTMGGVGASPAADDTGTGLGRRSIVFAPKNAWHKHAARVNIEQCLRGSQMRNKSLRALELDQTLSVGKVILL